MTFNVLSYLDGIGLDWLGLLRALLSARWILHGDKRTLGRGGTISMLDGWCVAFEGVCYRPPIQ